MARRGTVERWEALSPDYRARLESHGYTLSDYLNGVSREAARGHFKTPEHPNRAHRNPSRYSEYAERKRTRITETRQSVSDRIIAEYRRMAGSGAIDKLDVATVRLYIENMKASTFERLRHMTMDDIQAAAQHRPYFDGINDDDVLIDGLWINPFWYH